MYNINGLLGVLGCVCISFSILTAQPSNTSENYKKNYKKAQEWQYKNPDSTRFFANKALISSVNDSEKAEVYYLLGRMAQTQEWSNSAIHYYQKALKLYIDEKKKNNLRIKLITPYRRQKKFNTALRLARWVKRYLLEQKDTINLASNYSELGNIFFNISQVDTFSIKWTDSSLFYHRKAIQLRKKRKPKSLPGAYYNVSFAYEAISADSAIYYTKLALKSNELSTYRRMLYNIRLAQINYRKGDYETGNLNLDDAYKINDDDLNLRFLYFLYRNLIAIHLKDIQLAKKYIAKSDSVLNLMAAKTKDAVDKKGMSQIASDAYLDIYLSATKVFKQTKDSTYLKLANEYKAKKEQASRQYKQSNQLIEQKDSLLLAKTTKRSDIQEGVKNNEDVASSLQTWVIVLVIAFILAGWGVWWWLQSMKRQDEMVDTNSLEPVTDVQGLNMELLSTLAGQQNYEQIYTLLDKHIGVEGVEEKQQYLVPGSSLTFQEKVYLVLELEGFSEWEICQMLNQTKRTITEWKKRIGQKIKLPENPE